MIDTEKKSTYEYVVVCTSNEFVATGVRFLLSEIGKSGLIIKNHHELKKLINFINTQDLLLVMRIPSEPLLLLNKLSS